MSLVFSVLRRLYLGQYCSSSSEDSQERLAGPMSELSLKQQAIHAQQSELDYLLDAMYYQLCSGCCVELHTSSWWLKEPCEPEETLEELINSFPF